MGHSVITIAMTTGAQAEQVGRLMAERLGYRYVSDEIIDRAAAKVGVARDAVESVEHSRSLIDRLMQAMAVSAIGEVPTETATELVDRSPSYRGLIQQVIRETADEGNVVIVAHAAGILLAGMPSLLRVLVTASPSVRAQRLANDEGLAERAADRRVARTDRERAAYFRRFYDLREELPTHYDLVVNTDALSAEQAARLIATAATG